MPEVDPDILIVGGGPAGMSALVWCHSLGLKGTLLEQRPGLGGQMREMYHRVSDYIGLIASGGSELAERFEAHLKELRLNYQVNASITEVDLKSLRIGFDGGWLTSRAIILATGARKRKLGIAGEERFADHGVSSSATRDHPAFAGRDVVVVGGGDSAFENSLILARVCPRVTLVHRSEKFRARPEWIRDVMDQPRISILTNTELTSIEGADVVDEVMVRNVQSGEQRAIPTQGVFVRLGMTPNTELFRDQINLDGSGYIMVSRRQETSLPNVYAIGDVTNPVSMSVATAVGHAANAVKAIKAVMGDE